MFCDETCYFIQVAVVIKCFNQKKKSQNEVYLMQCFSQRCFSKVVMFISIDNKDLNIQPHQISVFVVPESLIMHSLKSCEEFPIQTFS